MDQELEESFLVRFIKENKIIVGLVIIGVFFLGIGAIQFFGTRSSDISIEKAPLVEGVATSEAALVVDIEGQVNKPGVYRLGSDARVQDVVKAAGGFSPNADTTYISKYVNLAQKLTDGAKIFIPKVGENPTTQNGQTPVSGSISSNGMVNINTASEQDLDALPGIGAVTAGKIISGRPYSDIQDLLTKKIVSQKVFDEIKNSISVL